MKILSKISIFDKDTKKILEFSKINIAFGYSKSSKTSFLKDLNSIFLGKNKHVLVNGTRTIAGDFNVFLVETKDGIKDHLKLSSKSLLRKLILDSKFSDDFQNISSNVSMELGKLKEELESIIKGYLPNLTFDIDNVEEPVNLLLDNASVSLDIDSSTEDKEGLFALIDSLSKTTESPTIVIIDDFNNDLDEEATINFFNLMNNSDAYFILSTKRPLPQNLINENTCIFAIRESKIYAIPQFEKLVLDALELKESNHTFEEYMLGNGYLKESNEYKLILNSIKFDNMNNIFRILTSKQPIIASEPATGKVVIFPKNDYESKLYHHLFNLLELDN